MTEPKPVYLVNNWKGRVATQHQRAKSSAVVVHNAGAKGDEQKWILESGEEPHTIALKCVANGEYLHGIDEKFKPADTGEKTWWKMSYDRVTIPGSFRLHLTGTDQKHWLECEGIDNTGAEIQMNVWQDKYEHSMTWRFSDGNVLPNSAQLASTEQTEDIAAKQKAAEEREAALEQKEQDLSAKERSLEEREATNKKSSKDREAALAQKESDNSAKEKALKDLEAALAQQEKNSSPNRKAFEDREAAFKQKEKDFSTPQKASTDCEAARTKQQKDSATNEKGLEDRKAALAQQEEALNDREAALQQHEKDSAAGKKIFERRQAALGQREKDFAADRKAFDERETALIEKENKRAAEWDRKMKELQGLREAAAQLKKSDAGNSVGCASKHYKPPRKLNRKVIGLVYE